MRLGVLGNGPRTSLTPMVENENPRQNVTFPGNGKEAHGYLAMPSGGSGPGVVVVQEWWGLTDHVAGMVDRLAEAGFVAVAPDLYGGSTTHDEAEAARLAQELPVERAAADLSGAVDFLLNHEGVTGHAVGVVGFCIGGAFALHLAAARGERVAAVVPFYAVFGGSLPDFRKLRAAVQGHYGQNDAFIPTEQATQVFDRIESETGSKPTLYWYPAGHAFMNEENLLGTYNPEAARMAWERTVAFLREHLGQGS